MSNVERPPKRIFNPAGCLLLAALLCSCAYPGSSPARQPSGFFTSILGIYRGPLNHLHAIRGGHCPMYPTCSEYSRQAIARHGLAIGWMMTTDRLLRCGRDETRLAPKIMVDGQLKTYDPLADNDFWWAHKADRLTPHPPGHLPAKAGSRDKVFDLSEISN